MQPPENRSDAERRLIERAQTDPDFRRQLLGNPNATAAAELGIDIPYTITLHVVEEGAIGEAPEAQFHYWLVLPAREPKRIFGPW